MTGLKVLVVYAQPVFWSMGEGKGATFFSDLPAAIAARGHEVRVSMPALEPAPGAVPDGDPLIERYRGFDLYRAPARRSFVPKMSAGIPARLYNRLSCWVGYQRWGTRAARRACRGYAPDLVLGMGYFEAPVARRLAVSLDVPNVTRVFGCSLTLTLRSPLRFHANFPEVAGLRTPADLIVITDDGAGAEEVTRRLKVPPDRVRHLRNGLDFDLFRPGPPPERVRRALGLRADQPMLLSVTRLAPEEELERGIMAMRTLAASHPGATLVILGDGPERERLRRLCLELGVADRVRFPGPVLHDQLPEWYRSADLVLSLLDRTNASNPVFEAMACATPPVALDVGTTSQVIRHGETGVLVPPADLPRIGEVLADLLGRPERMRAMGESAAGAIRALLMHKRDRMALEMDLLERVAAARVRAGAA